MLSGEQIGWDGFMRPAADGFWIAWQYGGAFQRRLSYRRLDAAVCQFTREIGASIQRAARGM